MQVPAEAREQSGASERPLTRADWDSCPENARWAPCSFWGDFCVEIVGGWGVGGVIVKTLMAEPPLTRGSGSFLGVHSSGVYSLPLMEDSASDQDAFRAPELGRTRCSFPRPALASNPCNLRLTAPALGHPEFLYVPVSLLIPETPTC